MTYITSLARPLILGMSALALISVTTARAEEAQPAHETHWSYEGAGSPEHWGDLKPDYNTCKTGNTQSPIDISSKVHAKQHDIAFSYKGEATDIVNNGHTIQVNMAPGSTITVGGQTYALVQFHFHSPSEHTVDGKHAAMVVHLVHKTEDGQLGVIGVMMNAGKDNQAMAPLWKVMPKEEGQKVSLENTRIDLDQLLPKDKTYYSYMGSLTTPPCSEGVHWMVMKNRITVSKAQIAAFTKIFPHSTRPVQPLNGRTVSGG
jgi:carbonic anhydrase